MEAWKHSQYFFRQPLFLQLQPLLWRARRGRSPALQRRPRRPAHSFAADLSGCLLILPYSRGSPERQRQTALR